MGKFHGRILAELNQPPKVVLLCMLFAPWFCLQNDSRFTLGIICALHVCCVTACVLCYCMCLSYCWTCPALDLGSHDSQGSQGATRADEGSGEAEEEDLIYAEPDSRPSSRHVTYVNGRGNYVQEWTLLGDFSPRGILTECAPWHMLLVPATGCMTGKLLAAIWLQ